MGRYSLHDGKFQAEKISITGKILVSDRFENVLASTSFLRGSVRNARGTAIVLSTAPDVPRNLKIRNAGQAAYLKTRTFTVTGYDAMGNYITEIITAGTAAVGQYKSNNAFAYIGTVKPQARVAASYGTFSIHPCDKLGLSHPLKSKLDIKAVTRYNIQSTVSVWNVKAATTSNFLGSATDSRINITYNTIDTTAAADNVTGSTLVVRYLTEFQ